MCSLDLLSTESWKRFDLKSNFHIIFKTSKDKKKLEASLGKSTHNYQEIPNEMVYEQKPVKLDDLNKADEKEIRREKKSALRKENTKEGKLLKIINF